jgi:hypothetical protein
LGFLFLSMPALWVVESLLSEAGRHRAYLSQL